MSSKPTPKSPTAVLSPNEAITLFENTVKSQPTAANYLELGAAYYIAKRWDDAIGAFEKAVELDPGQAFAYYYLGILYASKGERDKADAALEQVLRVSTNPMLKDQARTRIPNVTSIIDLGGK